jgi:dipeptidyl aminopeptidase/acylaminoacyl peptidase
MPGGEGDDMAESGTSQELTAELVTGRVLPQSPVISPDGQRVAYLVVPTCEPGPRAGRDIELRVAPADGGGPEVRLAGPAAGLRCPRWAPGSDAVYVLAGGELRQIGLDGAARTMLTWGGEVSAQLPLAGGAQVALLAADEPDAESARRAAAGDDAMVWGERDGGHRLRLLELATGKLTTVAGLGTRHVTEVTQRPDGGPLAVLTWACPQDEPGAFTARLHAVDPGTGAVTELGPTPLEAQSLGWWQAADGWHLAYIAVTPPGAVGGMAVFDVAVPEGSGPGEPGGHQNLTAGLDRCVLGLAQAGGALLALFAAGLDTAVARLDPVECRFAEVSLRRGSADSLSASADGATIAARLSAGTESPDVWAGPPGGPLARISDTCPGLRTVRWGEQQRVSWRAADGLELDGLLVLPPGRSHADGPFPLVMIVHGGPYSRYCDQLTLAWVPSGQWLAAAGFAAFLPNPRGSSGRGHEFAATVAGAVGQDEWTDLLSGIDHLVQAGIADPGRLGIAGWSHGGFMAAWAVGQTTRFRAALMGAGIADWGMQVGYGEFGRQEADLGGSAGWESPGPHRHDQLSPIGYVSRASTPVLILHGEQDTNVPVGQAVYFQRALSEFGVEHELVIYPREGHGCTERAHQADVLERTRAWFTRWLR